VPLLLTLLFYAPLLLGLRTFPDGDFTHHFLPFALYQQAALAEGVLPVWNPYTYGGHPFLADLQAAVFYPLSNLVLLATLPVRDAAARLYLLQLEAVIHVVLAGVWFGLLLRTLTGRRLGGVVAGIAFAFSGYLTGYPPLQLAVLRTAVWLPLVWWCLLRGWQRPRSLVWWVVAGAAMAAAFLGGHAQTFMLLLYATAAWVILLATGGRVEGNRIRRAAGLGLAGLIAWGLAAAQWAPSLEFTGLSVRARVDYAFVSGGFPLQDTWQMLVPGVLTQYSPLYVGVVGLELAVCALVWAAMARRAAADTLPDATVGWRAGVLFFALLALLALLASYGGNGFLYPLLYRMAPGWKLFRGQERAAYLVTVGLAGLAGYGAALAPTLPVQARRRAAVLAGALAVAGVYAFGLLWQLPRRTAIGSGAYLVVAAVTLVLGMAAALLVAVPGWSWRRGLGLAALVAANLFWANGATNLDAGTPADKVRPSPEMAALAAAVADAPGKGLPGRVYNEYRIYDDYGMRLGIEDVWGSSPLRLARYARLFQEFPLDRMWRLLGVAHVLTWRRELFGPSELLGEFPQATDTTYLHRLPEPAPRAWLTRGVMVVGDDEAWTKLADHQFDLESTALAPPESGLASRSGTAGDVTVTLARAAAGRLRVTVESAEGGLLVVAENWMPGWEVRNLSCAPGTEGCTMGGAAGELFRPVRADLTLVAVPVPAGTLQFDLVYAPASVRWGLWISAVTLGLAAVLLAGQAWSGRSRRGPAP
jgi:hypothetical protein